MLRLLKLLIFGVWKVEPKHVHDWETTDEKIVNIYASSFKEYPCASYRTYFLRCKTCGIHEMQKFKVV